MSRYKDFSESARIRAENAAKHRADKAAKKPIRRGLADGTVEELSAAERDALYDAWIASTEAAPDKLYEIVRYFTVGERKVPVDVIREDWDGAPLVNLHSNTITAIKSRLAKRDAADGLTTEVNQYDER